jgi:hypothetical protein
LRLVAVLTGLALLSAGIAGPAAAQDESPTTPGALPNPGSYQGRMALQQQDRQQWDVAVDLRAGSSDMTLGPSNGRAVR